MHVVTVVSGGMDSVTLAELLHSQLHQQTIVSVDYGQRHRRELRMAELCAERLIAPWVLLELPQLGTLLSGSALTDPDVPVPDGHYAEESMRSTVVPNRNAILLSIAMGVAVAKGADALAIAAHAGDHFVYPDCRPEFFDALEAAFLEGNQGFAVEGFHILRPFIDKTKTDIAAMGEQLGVPWDLTWSCYRGADYHCGTCGTCVERREAFHEAGVTDPTGYAQLGTA